MGTLMTRIWRVCTDFFMALITKKDILLVA